jgi:hypothetical protein
MVGSPFNSYLEESPYLSQASYKKSNIWGFLCLFDRLPAVTFSGELIFYQKYIPNSKLKIEKCLVHRRILSGGSLLICTVLMGKELFFVASLCDRAAFYLIAASHERQKSS